MTALLIAKARLIDPLAGIDGTRDLLVEGAAVKAVAPAGSLVPEPGVLVFEAAGLWVMPGLVDPHVHLRDPGFPEKETIESGLKAAAAGGFTTVAAMANTAPVNDHPEVTAYMQEKARLAGGAKLVAVAALSEGLEGKRVAGLRAMAQAGARLFSDDGLPVDDPELLRQALIAAAELGRVASLHEEDRGLGRLAPVNAGRVAQALGVEGSPPEAEWRRVARDLALAEQARTPVHIAHVSTRESLAVIARAKAAGVAVTCEATPHHLSLDDSAVLRLGTMAKMAPPLRSPADVEALRRALADGTVDMIASDHAPHDAAAKRLAELEGAFVDGGRTRLPALSAAERAALGAAANGVVGLETALGIALVLVHAGVISPARLVELMAINPARLLRLGRTSLAPRMPADITVVDPLLEWTVEPGRFFSKSRNTPFAGLTLKGRVVLTIVEGRVVYDLLAATRQHGGG